MKECHQSHDIGADCSSSKLTALLCAKDDCMVGTYSSGLGSETVLVYKHDELANSTDFYAFKYCPICGNKLGT